MVCGIFIVRSSEYRYSYFLKLLAHMVCSTNCGAKTDMQARKVEPYIVCIFMSACGVTATNPLAYIICFVSFRPEWMVLRSL